MNKIYKGIMLENLRKDIAFSHSQMLNDISDGICEANINIDYFEKLITIDKQLLSAEEFEQISALNSVANMNYQICNGGLDQYFFNEYDKYREPGSDNDVAQLDKEKQEEMLDTLRSFGAEIFPECKGENRTFEVVIEQFKDIYTDTVYNNDYGGNENIISGDSGFEDRFYSINDYLETLIECYAQYLLKFIEKELVNKKEKIDDLIKNAEVRSGKVNEAKESKNISLTDKENAKK